MLFIIEEGWEAGGDFNSWLFIICGVSARRKLPKEKKRARLRDCAENQVAADLALATMPMGMLFDVHPPKSKKQDQTFGAI